jgi:beta-lactamase regulating signal transducer with metallopeptidase domain
MNGLIPDLSGADLSVRVALTLGHFLWQGAVLALVALGACAALRRASAAARHHVLLGALLVMAACPIVTFVLLQEGQRVARTEGSVEPVGAVAPAESSPAQLGPDVAAPAAQAPPAFGRSDPGAPVAADAPGEADARARVSTSVAPRWVETGRQWLWRSAPWLTVAYLVGAFGMVVRLVASLWGGKRLRRCAEPVTDPSVLAALRRQAGRLGLRRVPVVAWCRRVASPAVVGVVRPVVLLPVALSTGMTVAQVESILAHELAHVRRLDPLVNFAQGIVEALLFFHPAVWVVSHRLRAERENCCDDMVLGAGGAPLEYVKSLVRAAELGLLADASHRPGAAALAAVGRPTQLRQRIIRLLQGEPAPQLRVSPAPLVVLILLAGVACTGVWYQTAKGQAADGAKAAAEDGRPPASTFTGHLVDARGRPLSNGYIYPEGTFLKRETVRSDKDGVFTLKDIQPDQKRWLVWSQRIGRRTMFTVPPEAPAEPTPIKVDYFQADIEGRVVDPAGNPVINVPVTAFVTAPDKTVYRFPAYSKTSEDGYYSVGDVPSAPGMTLRVGLSDDPASGPVVGPVPMANQFVYELPDLKTTQAVPAPAKQIPPRVRFGGRVVDEAGKPVAGAYVGMTYPKNQMISSAGTIITDADGRFGRLIPPDAESVRFRLLHPDFQGYHFEESSVSPSVEALKDGTAVLVMKRGLPVHGFVKGADGKPVENALVLGGRLYSTTPGPENEPIEDFTACRTDKDGSFRIGGMPDGWRELSIGAEGYAPTLTRVEVKPDMPPADLRLDRGATYSARLVDGAGKPVADMRVGIDEWNVGGDRRRSFSRVVTTDADGRFTFTNLPSVGSLEMGTGGRGFLSTSFNWAAEGTNPETITLYPPPVVRGRAVDAETGEPIPGALAVPMWGDPPHMLSMNSAVHANGEGVFELPIKYVVVHAPDYIPFAAKVRAPGYIARQTPKVELGKPYEPFVVKLEKGERLIGSVVDGDGNPAAGARVMFVEPKQRAYVVGSKLYDGIVNAPDPVETTGADGRFELPPTKAEGRILVLHDNGYMVLPYPGFAPGQRITLVPWCRVEGVVRKDGKPVHRAVVRLTPDGNQGLLGGEEINFQFNAATHTDGRFVIEKVPSASWKVVEGRDDKGVQLSTEPGETSTVEIGGAAPAER